MLLCMTLTRTQRRTRIDAKYTREFFSRNGLQQSLLRLLHNGQYPVSSGKYRSNLISLLSRNAECKPSFFAEEGSPLNDRRRISLKTYLSRGSTNNSKRLNQSLFFFYSFAFHLSLSVSISIHFIPMFIDHTK